MSPSRFDECLEALGWSQRYLAGLLGVAATTTAHWSSGRSRVDPRVAAWLEALVAARLSVPPLPEGWTVLRPGRRALTSSRP